MTTFRLARILSIGAAAILAAALVALDRVGLVAARSPEATIGPILEPGERLPLPRR